MKKRRPIRMILIFLMYVFLFNSCEKWKEHYDLFPLKVGNEFYYSYYDERSSFIQSIYSGNEIWKVASETSDNNSTTYIIERKFNGTFSFMGQVKVICDSMSLESVTESESSLISFRNISFQRYQTDSQLVIEKEPLSGSSESWSYIFQADRGMTSYSYHHPPNQVRTISIYLDSLKINQ